MKNRAAEIHDGLKHPVIDGDGHWMEPIPVFLEYLERSRRPESRRSDEGGVAPQRRLVSRHARGTSAQSPAAHHLVGRDSQHATTRRRRCCRRC